MKYFNLLPKFFNNRCPYISEGQPQKVKIYKEDFNTMKTKEWLNTWLNKYVKHSVKLRTYDRYKYNVEKHINPELGDYELEELSASVLQDFVLKKLEKGNLKTGGPLANNSVIGIVNIIKSALALAVSLEVVEKEYTNKIKLPPPTEKPVNAFEKQEQQILEQYCMNSKKTNHIGIVICLYTGLRIGELLALTWDDIDFENGILNIDKEAYKVKENGIWRTIIDKPKTKSSIRIIPIPKTLLSKLKEIKKKSKFEHIISTRENTVVDTRSYQKTYERILNNLHIPYKNFHSLRHTFATRAVEFGIDVKSLAEIMGHKNPTVTLQRYTHSLLSYKKDMMNKLGKMLLTD